MFFKYGSFTHDENRVDLSSFQRRTIFNGRGIAQFEEITMRVSGVVLAATQAALTTKIEALEAAYDADGKDAGLFQDDGAGGITTVTPHKIINSQTATGTRVDSLRWGGPANSGEYATGRTFEIAFSATVALSGGTTILSFQETLIFTGTTGPRDVWIEIRNGPARRQRVSQRTTQRITQRGQAVGLFSYIIPPSPIFAGIEHLEARQIKPDPPRQRGRVFTDFPISWSYEFESAQALSGFPNAV